ncbi:unnamed protein product, partial [Tetraodon nigroviridis]
MSDGELSPWCLPQLKIVLLGGRNSGKSSLGNLILGKEEFVTRERTSCSRSCGVVSGRRLTVVDTPGLVVSSGFSERRRRAVEEHVGLLGEGVWGHCMVVFTSAPAGEEGEPGQTHLRWLVDKCGHRCHTLGSGGDAEVAQLLEKIQELVSESEGAQDAEKLRPVTNIRIVLLGAKGSGKTSTLNTILGLQGSPAPGRTAQCTTGRGLAFGRLLTLVDTPGWWMNYFGHESSRFDRDQLILSQSLCPPGPHVFLLTVRVDRAFTETYGRAAQEHVQLMGPLVWDRVIVLFTLGDWLGGTTIERCVESEGPPLKGLLERCGNRYHVVNNRSRGDGFQVRELIRKMEEMLAGSADGPHFEVRREVMEQMEEK